MTSDNVYSKETCAYCGHFRDGFCTNDQAFSNEGETTAIHTFCEDGTLSEAIGEGFKDISFDEVEALLSGTKLSKNTQSEIMSAIREEFGQEKDSIIEEIDSTVSKALSNYDFDGKTPKMRVKHPKETTCSYFW